MGDLQRVRTVFELEVYKRAYRVSLDIHSMTLEFPKIEQYGGLADQMRRASKSICANLAEGWGKQTSAIERKRFLRIALGSATEMFVWLNYSRDLNYVQDNQMLVFIKDYNEVSAMLAAMLGKSE